MAPLRSVLAEAASEGSELGLRQSDGVVSRDHLAERSRTTAELEGRGDVEDLAALVHRDVHVRAANGELGAILEDDFLSVGDPMTERHFFRNAVGEGDVAQAEGLRDGAGGKEVAGVLGGAAEERLGEHARGTGEVADVTTAVIAGHVQVGEELCQASGGTGVERLGRNGGLDAEGRVEAVDELFTNVHSLTPCFCEALLQAPDWHRRNRASGLRRLFRKNRRARD